MSSGTTKRACACTCVLWVLRGDRTGWSDPQPSGQTYLVTSPHSLCNSDTPLQCQACAVRLVFAGMKRAPQSRWATLGAVTPLGRKEIQQPVHCQRRSSLSGRDVPASVKCARGERRRGEGTGVRRLMEWAHTSSLPRCACTE